MIPYYSTNYQTLDENGTVLSTRTVYGLAGGLSCSEIEAMLNSLSESGIRDKLKELTPEVPESTAGMTISLRDCGVEPVDGIDGEEPAINTDLSDETDVKYYDAP